MNFQNLNFDYVEPPRPYPPFAPRTPSNHSQVTLRPIGDQEHAGDQTGDHLLEHASSRPASPSPRPTVIPYAPTPPSGSTSIPEIYGPDRIFGPPLVPQSHAPPAPVVNPHPILGNSDIAYHAAFQWAVHDEFSPMADFKDELVRAAGAVTPGVDDSPYIQYALDAISRPDPRYSGYPSSSSEEFNPVRPIPDQGLGYYQPQPPQPPQFSAQPRQPTQPTEPTLPVEPAPVLLHDTPLEEPPRQVRPLPSWDHSPSSSLSTLAQPSPRMPHKKPVMSYEWVPMDIDGVTYKTTIDMADGYKNLHFVPGLLRPASLGALMILCLLMITALMFCAVFSQLHLGLVPYAGMSGGLYFVFRVLPQLLGCVILLYAQCTITTVYRFLPFVRMHSRLSSERHGAIFEDLHPRSFLWPQLTGPWQICAPIVVTWLANITLPLQSCLFTVILVDGTWKWAAVQGVAWTLVALYVALLISMGIMLGAWSQTKKTGLLWDVRSIADVIALVSDTNVAADYKGTEKLGTRDHLKWTLRRRNFDRLGYWTWRDGRPGFWYTIGIPMTDEQYFPRERLPEWEMAGAKKEHHDPRVAFKVEAMDAQAEYDLEASVHTPNVRYRYLPWCMRNNQLLYFVITAFVLLAAVLVVSFLPSTRIFEGFAPALPVSPVRGAFSSADFLYSFLPSFLGLIMYLLFQSLDLSLRILQPWASMSNPKGASVEESLLADYAACLPFQSSWHAARNGHWRMAIVSLLATLFVLIPVLAGGTFMAQTTADGDVRILPNTPLFAAILALLVLYFLALVLVLPGRRAFRLPHAVTCLAEIISFLANEDLLADPIFKHVRSRIELLGKLGMGREARDRPRWMFGPASSGSGAGGDERLGVRRMRKYTERRMTVRRARREAAARASGRRASDLR